MKGARTLALLVALGVGAAFFGCASETNSGLGGGPGTPAVCGNGVCEPGESTVTCIADCVGCVGGCGVCGNGFVEAGEDCDSQNLSLTSCAAAGFDSGGVSCKADCTVDTSACCSSECAVDGETRCNGSIVESCNLTSSGCRVWVAVNNCADDGKSCIAFGSAASCGGCAPQCPEEGASHCNGATIEVCEKDSSGCNVWAAGTDCAATGQSCDATSGTAACTGSCVSQCPIAGEKQCSGASLQACTDNGNGCLLWQTEADCSIGGGNCNATTKACVSGCTNPCANDGQQTCFGSVLNTCTQQSGCLQWVPTQDCTAQGSGFLCKLTGSQTAACGPACSDPCVTVGETKCKFNTIQTCVDAGPTCKEWQTTTSCPSGQTCSSTGGPQCVVAPMSGEDCGTAWVLQGGANTVNWVATQAAHMTSSPSCSSSTLVGPDVVMRYNPTFSGSIDVSIEKPVSNRWTMVASNQTCGVLTSPQACVSEFTLPYIATTVPVTSGSPVYFYLRDTNSGALPLSSPLMVTLTELNCGSFAATPTIVSPTNGATTTSLSPVIEVDFNASITPNQGTITLTGPGVNLSYNLATNPGNIVWQNQNKKLLINAPALPPGANVTVSWTGLQDSVCNKAVPAPTWQFTVVTPPCTPGSGNMVGSNVTRFATDTTTITEYYVEADNDPNGWVYVGGTSVLYRTKKNGGAWENIHTPAGLTSIHMGYGMVVDGNNLFTLDEKISGTTARIWRFSQAGGPPYALSDYATFQGSPSDDFRSARAYKGQIYMLTHEGTLTDGTEIWRTPSNTATLPGVGQFERGFSELYCGGLGVDDTYFYAACSTNNRVVRVHRQTGAVTLITNAFALASLSYVNALHAQDVNNDGTADYLYFTGNKGEVYFVCNPASATPYADKLVTFNSGTLTFGLGFDSVARKLYAYDDATKELVVIQ